jgi:hypothetical protein
MKNLISLILILGCTSLVVKENAFVRFHKFYEQRDFENLQKTLDRSIVIINDSTKQQYDPEKYLIDMKNWADVFDTKWNIVSARQSGDTTFSVEYDSDIFKDYFYGEGKRVNYKYIEKKGKLIYLGWDDGDDSKFEIYKKRYKAFANWCAKKYPYKYLNLQSETYVALTETKAMLEEYLKEIGHIKSM